MGGRPSSRTRGYKPALDGLRALAVLAVLFFHGEIGAPGGFLGVSVFFTLSGYLITTLLLVEHARTGRISTRNFYARRLRRLLPASLLCFALVLALGTVWTASQRADLPGDLLASLLDVANWRFAFAENSYQDLFIGAPSPVAHFWSLAIEEQFYLILPIVAVIALRHGRRTFAITTGVLLGLSILATFLTSDRDLLYNGTHTRAAELLFGVMLAQLPFRRRVLRQGLRLVSPVALAALIVLVWKARITDGWLYEGGLLIVALLSAVLIGGVAHGGPLAGVLGSNTLAAIGRLSYGLYLFHWPIFLVLNEDRMGFGGVGLFIVRSAVSLTAALMSYRIIEFPIRHRRRLVPARRAGFAALGAIAAVATAAVLAVPAPSYSETEELLQQAEAGGVIPLSPVTTVPAVVPTTAPPTAAPSSASSTVPDDSSSSSSSSSSSEPADATTTTEIASAATEGPPTVLVVGSDPTPLAALTDAGYDVVDAVQRDCAIATSVELAFADGTTQTTEDCRPSWVVWAKALRESSPDAVVVSTGPLDRARSRGPGDDDFPDLEDLVAEADRLDEEEADLRAAVDILAAAGVDVWIVDHRGEAPKGIFDDRLARIELDNAGLVRDVVSSEGELVPALDAAFAGAVEMRTLRVLVIGDSVSLNLARALADGVPGTLDVVWAGQNGCPLARVRATRVSEDLDWQENTCDPFDTKLPPLLDSYVPDVVVLMVSLRELTEQLYWEDDEPHVPGDAAYTAFHDAEMAALVGILEPRGIPLLIADTPPIVPGAMASEEMADQVRVDAWNAQIQRWADEWPIVDVLQYAVPLLTLEAEIGSIRKDGVHPEIDPLVDLARDHFVPDVLEQTRVLRAIAAS